EERFRAISEAIPVPVMISRKSDSVILYVNKHFGQLIGLDPSELAGRKTLDFFYDLADRQGIRDTLQREGYIRAYEFRAKRADGTPFWVVTSSQPLVFEGEQAYLSGFYELTEHKRAEEALRKSEETARALLNAPMDTALLVDAEGTVIAINRIGAQRLGKSVDELVGSCIYDCMPQDVAEKRKEKGDEIIRSGQPGHYEDVRQGRYFDNVVYPVLDSQGKVDKVAVFARDITERKRAEEALKESEEKFKTLVANAPIGLSVIAKDGTYEYLNPKFIEMFGYTLEDVPTGKRWFEKAYPDPEYRQEAISCWMENLREAEVGETRPRVFAVACKDRSKKEIFFRPVGLTGGRQLVTYEDITSRKRAEEALKREKQRVQRLADEREIVAKIGRIVSSTLEIDKVYELFAEEVRKLIPFDWITITIMGHERGTVYNAYFLGPDIPERRPEVVIPLAGSLTEQVMQTRSGQLVQAEDRDEVAGRLPGLLPFVQAEFQ
ncbi:MAG: PAS domain S-box protein, partial [Candidatus Hydrogenedentota bacterium]